MVRSKGVGADAGEREVTGVGAVAGRREITAVGGGIAAVSGIVLLGSLFADWYTRARFCELPCGDAGVGGWSALGLASVVPAVCGAGSFLPMVWLARGDRPVRLAAIVPAVGGLGAALLILFRLAVLPGGALTHSRLAGPFIALLGAAGVTGGSVLAGIGRRLFERVQDAVPMLVAIVFGNAAVIASLFMPWVRRTVQPPYLRPGATASVVVDAWHASTTLGVLLLLGALAIVAAAGLVAVIRWRAAFFALALGGWLLAVIAAVATPLVVHERIAGGATSGPAGYGSGYYLCLGCAAAIVLVGTWAAIADARAPRIRSGR